MPIQMKCSCGKMLVVDEQYRGKKAKCPSCGNEILVQDASTAVRAEAPRPSAAGPKKAAPQKEVAKPAAKSSGRRLLAWLAAGGCSLVAVFACFLCGGVGAWLYFAASPPAEDLKFVHDDIQGFACLRCGDILKDGSVKDALARLPAEDQNVVEAKLADMDQKLGFSARDVERFTFIFGSADLNDRFAAIIRAQKVIDRKKLVATVAALGTKEKKHGKFDYLVIDGPKGASLYFASDRILVMASSEAMLHDLLDRAAKPVKDKSLSRGVELAGTNKHAAVAAFKLDRKLLQKIFRNEFADFGRLTDASGFVATATLDKRLTIELTCDFDSPDDSRRARGDGEALLRKIKTEIRVDRGDRWQQRMIFDFITSLDIENRGSQVVMKGRADVLAEPIVDIADSLNLGGASRMTSTNNLKQIGLAMHEFHDANKVMPNHAILHHKTGQPLLSWRVALLPYINHAALFQKIRLDESWDSPHNRQFWDQMPDTYQLPGKPKDGRTYYQVFHGPDSAMPANRRVTLIGITDGTSNTVFAIEAAKSVPWMKPEDLPFPEGVKETPIDLTGNHLGDNHFQVLMCDGVVLHINRKVPPTIFYQSITRAGGEVTMLHDWSKFDGPRRKRR